MDIRTQTFNCDRCNQQHKIEIDFDQLTQRQREGKDPVLSNFVCPNIALMYRVFNLALDTRVRLLNNESMRGHYDHISNGLKAEWGEQGFPEKLSRFKELNLSFLGIPEEYYSFLWDIVSSYCCGRYYPAMTSAGALGERILNRLIIKTREYFKSSSHYKKIYKKDSFDQWDYPVLVLKEWGVISSKVAEIFLILKSFRNDSIHYNDNYDFEKNAEAAVRALSEIIDLQFNYEKRKDLLWVFDVPGEIWVKSEAVNQPFVKEFILPHCALITPYCEPTATPPIRGKNTPLKPLSDQEFMEARKKKLTT
ncbi:MAG: hypothetical protein AB7D06_14460 [Pedobacter sp.]